MKGGLRRGASNYDLLGLEVVVDTGQLFALPGGQFHAGSAVNFGTSLSAHYVGNSFPIQLADVAGTQPRLTYLSNTQSLFEDELTIRLGRVDSQFRLRRGIHGFGILQGNGFRWLQPYPNWFVSECAGSVRLPGNNLGRTGQIGTGSAILRDGWRL